MEHYKILTVTHKQIPVEQLGNYSIQEEKGTPAYIDTLRSVKDQFQLNELMYLNTCNRVTYFFTTHTPVDATFTSQFFKAINHDFEACNAINAYLYEGSTALEHLCELGASIDSMVVGEREIIRQLRVAYEDAQALDLTGDDIRLAMKMVIPAAKKILTETKIAEKPVSVVSLAALRLKELKIPSSARFLLIGAGETITQMSAYLVDMGFHDFAIFNRTKANAVKLANTINGKPYALSEIIAYANGFDVIICSTGSAKQEITTEVYASLLGKDTSQKVIIDLAVPADTAAEVLHNYPVTYISIDQLRSVAQKNLSARKAEVIKAKQMVHAFVKEFQQVYIERLVEKAHSVIPQKLNEIRRRAMEDVYAKDIAALDPEAHIVIDKLMDYMEKKYLALTMASSKEAFRHKHR